MMLLLELSRDYDDSDDLDDSHDSVDSVDCNSYDLDKMTTTMILTRR